jgi:hypothetical protein
MSDVQIKITHQHNDELDYHEWVYVRMEAVDRLGRPNPRMGYRDWQFWRCNNPECRGQAFVNNDFIRGVMGWLIGKSDAALAATDTPTEPKPKCLACNDTGLMPDSRPKAYWQRCIAGCKVPADTPTEET